MDIIDRIKAAADELAKQKDNAYAERNQCVALIAKLALANGYLAWVGQHSDEWDERIIHLQGGASFKISNADSDLVTDKSYNWYADTDGYIVDSRSGKSMHQIVSERILPDMPPQYGYTTDHIDQNPANNSRWNLRLATKRGQNLNRSLQAGKGIEKHGKKFRAYTSVDGKKVTLGTFETEAEAVDTVAKYRTEVLAKAETDGTFIYPKSPWDRDWRTIIFVELPTGQLSWHIHDSEVKLFEDVPRRDEPWDGHTTAEKHARMQAYKPIEAMSMQAWEALGNLKKAMNDEPALKALVKDLVR